MMRCSPEAFAQCPTRALCGSPQEATFTEGSECDLFNQSVTDRAITNADHIRAMSDEGLAAEFTRALLGGYEILAGGLPPENLIHEVYQELLVQLRQPYISGESPFEEE